jgi:predicted amidohydrolase/acetyl esterase/lipase
MKAHALIAALMIGLPGAGIVSGASTPSTNTVRVAAAQAARRVLDYRLKPHEVISALEKNFSELERVVNSAGAAKCDALVLPEDTPGLLNWVGANEELAKEVLPTAVRRMIERLGSAAARHNMYLVVCSDFVESDGAIYNTAFLLGRDGKEIGRYHKVCPTWSEAGVRRRGDSFPVFPTPDIGTAGMLICYDLVVPETARCLALAGADIIFFPTMGGAAIGDDDIGVQALRVRAAENFIWLVVAHRGSGAMIISPQGKIVARAEGPDGLAIADINVHGQREGGDALNWQRDMRARLFRERNPEAFRILTDTNAAVLAKAPIDLSSEEAGRIMARTLTVGEDEFKEANRLMGQGPTNDAITAFERLRKEYPGTWIDRRSGERLSILRGEAARFEPLVLDLWPGGVPDESGGIGPERTRMSPKLERKQVEVTEPTRLITAVTNPTITLYRPAKDKNTGTAVLICPGGGYWDLYWQLEGEEVAAWLNSIGVTGIILKYRVPRRPDEPHGEPARRPLQDAQRAISLVRSRAKEWDIDPQRIGIIGFSAGGHLAIATATSFEKRTYADSHDVDKVSCRPDFAIPVYSGYLKGKENDELAAGLRIPTNTPPIFLVHGHDDIISPPENSVLMYLALKRAGVPAELHVYANTTHDFGVRTNARPYATWTTSCGDWLRDSGFLKTQGNR